MAILTKDNIIDVTGTPEIMQFRSEFQIVKSVTLFDIENAYEPTDIYAEIGILGGGKTIAHRVALLNAGFCGSMAPLSWSGSYPTEADMFIYALLLGPAGHKYRLCASLWKIITQEGGTFIVDP